MQPLPVHIVDADGQEVRTQEHEPEHWVFRTAVIPPAVEAQESGGTGAAEEGNGWEQVLNTDPLRKDVILYFPDGPAVLCHSATEASNAANYAAGIPFPEGAYFPQGSNTPNLAGTGPMWVANPGPATVSQPAVPASGVAQQNPAGSPVSVTLTGFTATQVFVNGVLVGAGNGTYTVPAYGSISVTYTVAGTWTWASLTPGTIRVVLLSNRRGI